MTQRLTRIAVSLAVLLVPAPMYAQTGQRSAIEGVVTDPQGAVVRDITVALSGDRLIGGRRTITTDALGHFRFVELLPGTYDVEASAQGFKTIRRSHIVLPVETTYTVPFALQVADVAESVEVPATRALIDVRSAASPTIFDQPLLQDVPTNRTLDGVLGLTPGVTTPTPLYGVQGEVAFGGPQMSGNAITVDGVNTSGASLGFPTTEMHYNWFEQVQVSALGAPAEYGTFTGALANGVLRSGSNRVSGMGEYLTRRPSWTANNTGDVPADQQEFLPPTTLLTWWDLNGQVGAPIVRDRLWIFGGTSGLHHTYRSYGYPGPGATEERSNRTLVKMDGALTRNVTLQGFISRDARDTEGTGLSIWNTAESRADTTNRTQTWNVRANAVLSSKTMLTLRGSGYFSSGTAMPHPPATIDGPSPSSDQSTGIACCNSFWDERHNSSTAFEATASHYRQGRWGRHDIKGGFEYEVSPSEDRSGIPTNQRLTTNNGVLVTVETWNGDHPSVTGKHAALYVQDRWTLNGRITLEPGLRAEFNRGTIPGVASDFTTSPVALRLGVAWDLTGTQSTVLRAHYGRFYDPLYTDVYSYFQQGVHSPHIFYSVQDGQHTELFRYTEESSVPPSSTFSQSHVDQWVLGLERAVGPHTTVQLQYVNRRFGDLIGWVDPRIDEWIPYEVGDPGPDGIPGTSDDGGMFTAYQSYPGNRTLLLSNPLAAYRQYNGVQLITTRRFADRWQYQVSYSWSRSNGTVDDVYGTNATYWSMNPNGYGANKNVEARGAVPPTFDYSEFKAIGSYRPPWLGGFTTGMALRWHNGTRWQRDAFVTDPIRIGFPAEPVGSRTTPSIGGLDLRVEKTFGLRRDSRLGLYADFFNVTNVGRATGYDSGSGPNFGKATTWTDPREAQIGLRYSF